MGTRDGNIIATIITTHMPRNPAAAPDQDWPGILIQAIDMIQPPGIGMPPDIEPHQATVAAALATNRSALAARNPRSAPPSVRVPVMVTDPGLRELQAGLVAPLGDQVQEVVGAVQHVDAPGVGGVGVEDRAVRVLVEDADAFAVRHV